MVDREKLAFFGPDGYKYTFKIMPFRPTNAPGFYSPMMKHMKEEWDTLFLSRLHELGQLNGQAVIVSIAMEVYISEKKLVFGTKIIIGDILLWYSNVDALLIYFECICRIFRRYRVSFRLDKCDFMKPRVEYVGHDITNDSNCPASSKFDIINNWHLPERGES